MYGEDVMPMFKIPVQMTYEKMIHELSKLYGQCKYYIADKYRETDYWELVCFEGLKNSQERYEIEKKNKK